MNAAVRWRGRHSTWLARSCEMNLRLTTDNVQWNSFDAVLTVGRERLESERAVTINSNGWIARIGGGSGAPLPWRRTHANAVGALAAACLGAGAIAVMLLKLPRSVQAFELSLFEHRAGPLGSLDMGPPLPTDRLDVDALVVGCGAVTNGWAYTVRRLPIRGALEAVDKESLRKENLGLYVLSTWGDLGKPKSALIRRVLRPAISVTPRPEPFDFYKIRIDRRLVRIPRLVIAGLDEIPARHAVQRLWPEVLIDMAGGGTTTQLVIHRTGLTGICLLEALREPEHTLHFAEQMAAATGLSVERIRGNPTDLITAEDVASAHPNHRKALEAARRQGRQLCGRITDHNLYEEGYTDEFAAAVPFVSAFAGVIGAAETMKALMGLSVPLHHQFEFRTMRGRRLELQRSLACECAQVSTRHRGSPVMGGFTTSRHGKTNPRLQSINRR